LHTTAASHNRIIVVEVMGRYAGWIALESGVAGSADVILIPEIPFDLEKVARKIRDREERGSLFSIVLVAEGAKPKGGEISIISRETGRAERLGGIGEKVAAGLQALTDKETRLVVLGHLLRGGTPTRFDRIIAQRFGAAAVRAIAEVQRGIMVALDPPTVKYVPLEAATKRMKTVPPLRVMLPQPLILRTLPVAVKYRVSAVHSRPESPEPTTSPFTWTVRPSAEISGGLVKALSPPYPGMTGQRSVVGVRRPLARSLTYRMGNLGWA
jgi:6-phosphofructokinase